ncbi:MAG: AAA family ATPase [Chloroflexota bacterium]
MTSALSLPADALVLLIGISGSGKTTFASRHFRPTQILSSDALRAMIADDPTAQDATEDAFDLLHRLLEMRLRRGRLTVVDATNVEEWARRVLVALARRHRRPVVAIVLDLPFEVLHQRNEVRRDGSRPRAALTRQARWLRESLLSLPNEGFDAVHRLGSAQEIDAVRVELERPR